MKLAAIMTGMKKKTQTKANMFEEMRVKESNGDTERTVFSGDPEPEQINIFSVQIIITPKKRRFSGRLL